ncbi:hypothetical protein FRUB_01358 [Fimbriiglobus ruber]|uniref:Uncharacterized protein n=1 Tax=Fimbriiglobus ruber TaxID=1908690 RepID=A0A225E9C5_9BACT|nr:hypothetical protein FRUB_01358 [Fimbriiglobus ruber]
MECGALPPLLFFSDKAVIERDMDTGDLGCRIPKQKRR